jgi:hypothetical protein
MESQKPPSTSSAPDLDWSQVRETIRILQLATAQIDMAMREGDDSIDTLSRSFRSMVGSIEVISETAADLDEGTSDGKKESIEENCRRVSEHMHSSIIAFQFYDKLSQRLSHVRQGLDALAELVGDTHKLYNPYEWKGLQKQILSLYSMQEEVEMFDAVLNGATVEEALQQCQDKLKARVEEDSDDIELF